MRRSDGSSTGERLEKKGTGRPVAKSGLFRRWRHEVGENPFCITKCSKSGRIEIDGQFVQVVSLLPPLPKPIRSFGVPSPAFPFEVCSQPAVVIRGISGIEAEEISRIVPGVAEGAEVGPADRR